MGEAITSTVAASLPSSTADPAALIPNRSRWRKRAGLHPLLDDSRGLTQARVAQFLILNARNLDVDIDAVEQRTGNAFLVFGDDTWRAGTKFDQVAEKATWLGGQCNTKAGGKV